MKKPEIVARAMSFVTLAIAGIMIVSIAKTSAWAGNKKEETKNIKTYYSYDVMKNINYKADNDARYKELTSGSNLNEIKQKAQELGMKPANENQIVYYEVEHKNYMDQYENVE